MACRYSFHFVQKATEDLDGIIFYLTYQLGSPQAARTFLNSLDHTIQEACTFPESGPLSITNSFPIKRSVKS